MKERIAIIDGIRTTMAKAGGPLKNIEADDLGAIAVKEILNRVDIDPNEIDEVIIGNVAQPSHAMNVGRVIALKAGIPEHVPAISIHRNCASGMEAISTGAMRILSGEAKIILAGGAESMSNIPLLFGPKMTAFFDRLFRSKTVFQKLSTLFSFRLKFLKPRIGLVEGLTDPVSGLIMGLTAENIAREFHVTREEQDAYALKSHQKAVEATKKGYLKEEYVPVPLPKDYKKTLEEDHGPREDQSLAALAKLKPYFDRKNGTVTVGNACPVNDGAAAMILMSESEAKKRKLEPLGYLSDFAYAGLDPKRMGLGPVFATSKLLDKTGLTMDDFELIELNEAFSAQVIACKRAFESKEFAKKELGKDKAIGTLDLDKVNVNGGAVALGHPVGMTGIRITLTLLKEMKRRGLKRGLATLCVGGGQGASFLLETK